MSIFIQGNDATLYQLSNNLPESLELFMSQLKSFRKNLPKNFRMFYIDQDEDQISINNYEDLVSLYDYANQVNEEVVLETIGVDDEEDQFVLSSEDEDNFEASLSVQKLKVDELKKYIEESLMQQTKSEIIGNDQNDLELTVSKVLEEKMDYFQQQIEERISKKMKVIIANQERGKRQEAYQKAQQEKKEQKLKRQEEKKQQKIDDKYSKKEQKREFANIARLHCVKKVSFKPEEQIIQAPVQAVLENFQENQQQQQQQQTVEQQIQDLQQKKLEFQNADFITQALTEKAQQFKNLQDNILGSSDSKNFKELFVQYKKVAQSLKDDVNTHLSNLLELKSKEKIFKSKQKAALKKEQMKANLDKISKARKAAILEKNKESPVKQEEPVVEKKEEQQEQQQQVQNEKIENIQEVKSEVKGEIKQQQATIQKQENQYTKRAEAISSFLGNPVEDIVLVFELNPKWNEEQVVNYLLDCQNQKN